jgi:hypothetical protein
MLKKLAQQFLPPKILGFLDDALFTARRMHIRSIHRLFGVLGYNVSRRTDYYSPLPVLHDLKQTLPRWSIPSHLPGLKYDLSTMRDRLFAMDARWRGELETGAGSYETNAARGFGPGYPKFDARVLYYMLREIKPKRYLEVGSGLSTYYAGLAGAANGKDSHPLEMRCVEPYPYAALRELPNIEIIQKEAQDVPLSAFETLQSGDVLFIDSSHALKVDSDVAYLFLEVLPRLAKGVYIHIHDVPFPYNTPYPASTWIFGEIWPAYWNEAMVVQAFLAFNSTFEIVLSTPLIRHFDEACLTSQFPDDGVSANEQNPFSSLWIRRTA